MATVAAAASHLCLHTYRESRSRLLSSATLADQVLEKLVPCLDQEELLVRLHALLQDVVPHDAGLIATRNGERPAELRLAVRHGWPETAAWPDWVTPATLIDPWQPE